MAPAKLDPKAQAKAFEKYISDKKILIADPSGPSRISIANVLSSMGAKASQFVLTSSYQEAEDAIEKSPPGVIITDFELGKRCGLDLMQKLRSTNANMKNSLFVLVTSNTSQSAVAKAAEEDVDMYVIKPFTAGVFRASVMKAALTKIDPPEYTKVIDRGKVELDAGKIEEALKTFEYATTLDTAPSLGCFYTGKAHNAKQDAEHEEGSYARGLEYNKIHYKCLLGLYENFATRKKHHEAYEVIKKVSHYFPANPQRLTAVLRLAIMTQSYEDVERYYRIFTSIDERNEEMIKYICAALVVCGKYYLQQNFGSRALELFQKAAVTASGRTKILREIITSLMDFGLAKQADEFLRRFPPDTHKGVDYQAMNLLIMDQASPRTLVIEKGRDLLNQNLRDPIIYRVLLKRNAEHGLKHAVDDLMAEALKHFPEHKTVFDKALTSAGAPAPAPISTTAPKTPPAKAAAASGSTNSKK